MSVANLDFLDVTELAGNPITGEQLERLVNRYVWATKYCQSKDVAEIACGTGPGLGLLDSVAGSFEAADFSPAMLGIIRKHYGDRIVVKQFDAQEMPYDDASKDILIIFEAIYYIKNIPKMIDECRRVLRPGGKLLIATANKDLSDFNPSPYSHRYLGTVELAQEFSVLGSVELFGYLDTAQISWRQKLLRPVKALVVGLGLMPKSMMGKRVLKRLVFGQPVIMPAEIMGGEVEYHDPVMLVPEFPDSRYKVLFCVVTK